MQKILPFSIETFPFDQISMLHSDARHIEKGGCFFAIPGTMHKGSEFIQNAKRKGSTHFIIPKEEAEQINCTGGAFYTSNNIRRDYALAAASLYKSNIPNLIAITGTNGKSSITEYIRQLFEALQEPCASFGTIGFESQFMAKPDLPQMTSLDAADFHQLLQKLDHAEMKHFIFETSSHGLDQYRSDGVRIKTAIFTNLSLNSELIMP